MLRQNSKMKLYLLNKNKLKKKKGLKNYSKYQLIYLNPKRKQKNQKKRLRSKNQHKTLLILLNLN